MPERKKRIYDFSKPAYSSDGKSDFRHKLTIIFDFKDYDRSIRKAREAAAQVNQAARDMTKKLKGDKVGAYTEFGLYIPAGSVASRNSEGNQLLEFELPASGPELSAKMNPFLKRIGQAGKDIMLSKYITRKETNLMRKSIGYMQRRRGNNEASVEIGWIRKWYKYFGWQEMGTSGGIPPMAGIIRTKIELEASNGVVNKTYNEFFRKEFLEKGKNR